jgi:hypothetical protein
MTRKGKLYFHQLSAKNLLDDYPWVVDHILKFIPILFGNQENKLQIFYLDNFTFKKGHFDSHTLKKINDLARISHRLSFCQSFESTAVCLELWLCSVEFNCRQLATQLTK